MKLMYFQLEELRDIFPLSSLILKRDREESLSLPIDERNVFYVSKRGFTEIYSDSIRIEVEGAPEIFKRYNDKNDLSIAIADNELVYMNDFNEKLEFMKSDVECILSLDFLLKFTNRCERSRLTVVKKKKKGLFSFFGKKIYYCMFVKDPNEELLMEETIYNDYEERYKSPTIAYRRVSFSSQEDLESYIRTWERRGFFPYFIKKKKEIYGILDTLDIATRGKSINRKNNVLENYILNPALLVHESEIEIFSYETSRRSKPDLTLEEYEEIYAQIKETEDEENEERKLIIEDKREELEEVVNEEIQDFYYKYTMERLTGYTGKYIGKKPLYEKRK